VITQSEIGFDELHISDSALTVVEECGSVVGPTIFVAVLLSAGTAGDQEDEVVFGRSNHATLLLTAKPSMNITLAVVQLLRDEKRFRCHVELKLYK
jgi:hypothetical protein